MEKIKDYKPVEVELISFKVADIITSSTSDDELPPLPVTPQS